MFIKGECVKIFYIISSLAVRLSIEFEIKLTIFQVSSLYVN